MRKLIISVLCMLLIFSLCACQNDQLQTPTAPAETQDTQPSAAQSTGVQVFRFPEGTVLCGQDISGMLKANANSRMRDAVEKYTLNLTINDQNILLTGKEMGLQFHPDIMEQFIEAIKNGEDSSAYVPISYNPKQLKTRISVRVNVLPQNVSMVYDAEANGFVFTDHVPGTDYDLSGVITELDPVIMGLNPVHTTTASGSDTMPLITADTDRALEAQENANNMLRNALTYAYAPDNSKAVYEALTVDHIGSFLTFDSNLNPVVNEEAVYAYASEMAQCFSVGQNDGKFLTSSGDYVDLDIYYADQLVDTDALAADIIYCIENGVSGVRTAPYLPAEKGLPYDLGGQYAEIDLTKQCLWIYNNYECVMYTPVVTGCLGNGWGTPNGAYEISYKEVNATISGLDVSYWMPFNGNIGMHDAPWRAVYDDDEYLFNGSHGCINIPPVNARTVFRNVSWDSPVIVYGGAHYGHPVTQELTATTEYHVGINAEPFELDAMPKYGYKSRLTYTVDNTNVITVSRKGVVTVVGPGTATIKIETPDWDFCPTTSTEVTITVHESCTEQGHMVVNWKTKNAPKCKEDGLATGICSACGIELTQSIPACHNFDDWETVTAPTCTEDGQEERICLACGETETQTVSATGHSYCNWNIREATQTQDGKKTATCYFCKDNYEEILPASN